MQEAIPPIINV